MKRILGDGKVWIGGSLVVLAILAAVGIWGWRQWSDRAPVVFIYHSHSTESYVPELRGIEKLDDAYDDKVNVTLVGRRLADSLRKQGISTVHSNVIYPNVIGQTFDFTKSYEYSADTLIAARSANGTLNYFFDIHRDAYPRSETTVNVNGKDYASAEFVIGQGNNYWIENENFAYRIHDILEKKVPGVSKGVLYKSKSGGNGVYNEDFSPNLELIEIGGPENTLEECYRTADLIAAAVAEIIKSNRNGPAAAP